MRTLCLLLLAPFSVADDAFDFELFSRLAAREGNVVCSPLSVRVALAMAHGGARGTTAAEMASVLRLDGDGLAKLARAYDGKDGRPALADAAWVQEGATLLPAYEEFLARQYGAPPVAVDFGAADAAARRINAWVSERTGDRIRGIVSPDMFNANTTLVLANALHFKAAWEEPFTARTREAPFALASGERIEVPMMVQTEHFGYVEKDGAQAVELPYERGRYSMVVVLPREGVPAAVPEGLLGLLKDTHVTVHLPRFRVETAFRLEETLALMGMPSAFGPDADFSGMNGKKDLFVSTVAHKAFIAVDEEGTEAAAATAVMAEVKGDVSKPVAFRADRPFLFLIRDREAGSVLFLGRVSDPR